MQKTTVSIWVVALGMCAARLPGQVIATVAGTTGAGAFCDDPEGEGAGGSARGQRTGRRADCAGRADHRLRGEPVGRIGTEPGIALTAAVARDAGAAESGRGSW